MHCSHMDKMSALQSAISSVRRAQKSEPETELMATRKACERGALMATDWEKQ